MSYDTAAIANYFIRKAKRSKNENSMTQMKLLKLTYFAYGFYAAIFKEKLFEDPIQAWKYGPVVPSLYYRIFQYGNEPITSLIMKPDYDFGLDNPIDEPDDLNDTVLLDEVWKVYGIYSGLQLSTLSHASDGPWQRTIDDCKEKFGEFRKHQEIPYNYIEEYFKGLVEEEVSDN